MADSHYKSIAVAATFSPRFEQVLAEAKRARELFGAALSLIYVGERTAEAETKFSRALDAMKLPKDSVVHYSQGDPAEAILETIRAEGIELIVAGALEKEVVLRPFLGNVARRLVRDAPCAVLLFTKPEREPRPLRRIAFITNFSAHSASALQQTIRLAAQEKTERLYVVRIYTSFDEARAALRGDATDGDARTLEEEEAALEEFVEGLGPTEVPIEARCIRGNTGFSASDFVESVEADLLVVGLDSSYVGAATLPSHIAWITEVIPCNLWIIR